jgi:hypothetical protein
MTNRFEEAYGGEANSVTAAHEAGHVLVAWLSPAIARVHGTAWIQESGMSRVEVRTEYKKPVTAMTYWEKASVSAAGIAAELITHRRFRSGPARIDLHAMRLMIAHLCAPGKVAVPPWPDQAAVAPPFGMFFEGGLPETQADVFRRCYLRARERILSHRGAYERLRTAMIVKIELDAREIAQALRLPKA